MSARMRIRSRSVTGGRVSISAATYASASFCRVCTTSRRWLPRSMGAFVVSKKRCSVRAISSAVLPPRHVSLLNSEDMPWSSRMAVDDSAVAASFATSRNARAMPSAAASKSSWRETSSIASLMCSARSIVMSELAVALTRSVHKFSRGISSAESWRLWRRVAWYRCADSSKPWPTWCSIAPPTTPIASSASIFRMWKRSRAPRVSLCCSMGCSTDSSEGASAQ
mmetsp:Transcript_27581/g.70908  ORF Transcript_27581/g.70908 Transcript_27581/m.70908 type:complete len:224 (+) Transcript_27581:584-1255(+)